MWKYKKNYKGHFKALWYLKHIANVSGDRLKWSVTNTNTLLNQLPVYKGHVAYNDKKLIQVRQNNNDRDYYNMD